MSSDAYTLASSDIGTFLYREKTALANFCHKFGDEPCAMRVRAAAAALKASLNAHLWDEGAGVYQAYNVSSKAPIARVTHLNLFPVFGGAALVNTSQASRAYKAVSGPDMLSDFGLRSASSSEALYTNGDYVTPYSNWRGPVWINTNALIAYGLSEQGMKKQALDLAGRIVSLLAAAIRQNPKLAERGQAWRECYSSADGKVFY